MKKLSGKIRSFLWIFVAMAALQAISPAYAIAQPTPNVVELKQEMGRFKRLIKDFKETLELYRKKKAGKASPEELKTLDNRIQKIKKAAYVAGAVLLAAMVAMAGVTLGHRIYQKRVAERARAAQAEQERAAISRKNELIRSVNFHIARAEELEDLLQGIADLRMASGYLPYIGGAEADQLRQRIDTLKAELTTRQAEKDRPELEREAAMMARIAAASQQEAAAQQKRLAAEQKRLAAEQAAAAEQSPAEKQRLDARKFATKGLELARTAFRDNHLKQALEEVTEAMVKLERMDRVHGFSYTLENKLLENLKGLRVQIKRRQKQQGRQ